MLTLDIMSILIFNHKFKSNLDPLFDSKSPFTKLNINNYFYKYKCLRTLSKEIIIIIIMKIFPKISNKYIEYFNRIKKNIDKLEFNNIKYEIKSSEILIKNKKFINLN